jgi:hypothetical protein
MHSLKLVSNYCSDDIRREQLYLLFEKVFGINVNTFKDFYQQGFWDSTYCPYTFFDGETAVANVSMFSLPLIIHSKPVRAAGTLTLTPSRGKWKV